MKTFSELAECSARIPPRITLYGSAILLNPYNFFSLLKLLFLYFYFFQEAQIFLEEEDEILNPAAEERNNL